MATSEARIKANKLNSLKSTGPSAEGRLISRKNSLKHGLSGSGVVLASDDAALVDRREDDFMSDLGPKTNIARFLVNQMAVRSVQMDRSAKRESAFVAGQVRNASEAFDQARFDEAAQLIEILGDNPRVHLRKLRNSPDGVEAMIAEWEDLKGDLTRDGRVIWTASHRERAENLTGHRIDMHRGSRIAILSKAIAGDFHYLSDEEGGELHEDLRKVWARTKMIELIDAQIAGLEAHYETLDFARIAADRVEAGDRALFDPSKEAVLARRYQSEATRGFYKALNEIRKVEKEFAERPVVVATPEPAWDSNVMASFRENVPTPRDPRPVSPQQPFVEPLETSEGPEIVGNEVDWPDFGSV